MKSWVEVSGERLQANYTRLVEAADSATAVLAVVKANAYGHGAEICAPVLARAGAEWLGVTDANEGACVRRALTAAGIAPEEQPRILVMSGMSGEDAEMVIRHRLTPAVWQRQLMERLLQATGDEPLAVHLEIDTGMARQGVAPGPELDALLLWIKEQPKLLLEGVMTHFASSEVAGSPQTMEQRAKFEEALWSLAKARLRPKWVHAGSSSSVDHQSPANDGHLAWLGKLAAGVEARAMVRTGIALYGYCLPVQHADAAPAAHSQVRSALQPVMTWKTRVIGLREVPAGATVGYNATYTAERPMRLALLPVGYADGLRRELSHSNAKPGGWAMVHGQRAAILGRVSMNLTVIDVSEIPGVALDNEVVLLGDGVTADDHAQLVGTIAYEIVCGVRAGSQLV